MSRLDPKVKALVERPTHSRKLGPFLLQQQLGRGGFAPVWRAVESYDDTILREVAVKLFASHASTRNAIIQEARALCSVEHPNIVKFYTLVIDDSLGILGLVMEFVKGATLEHLLFSDPNARSTLDLQIVVKMALSIASAMAAIHQVGLIHRDIKPSNIVETNGVFKLIDFGIASEYSKAKNNSQARSQQVVVIDDVPIETPPTTDSQQYSSNHGSSPLSGTIGYIDPHCIRFAEEATRQSDLYSLGAILFECLTGRLPAAAQAEIRGLNEQILDGTTPAPPIASIVPSLPQQLGVLIDSLLAPQREHRPRSAEHVVKELENIAKSLRIWDTIREGQEEVGQSTRLDENVQFTVYRPKAIAPAQWYQLLAFAHLAEKRPDEQYAADPVEEVQRQAKQLLGASAAKYQSVTQDSAEAIPQEGELSFVPEAMGIEFDPPSRTFRWHDQVHREEFRLRASPAVAGKTIKGRVSVLLGRIVIAEVSMTLRVEQQGTLAPQTGPQEPSHARIFRKIYASYSHKDIGIVEEFERYARALGDSFLRDHIDLRTGESWSDSVQKLIEQADIFQLFWSNFAASSPFVEHEWRYALSLSRPGFVRATYWNEPLAVSPNFGETPKELVDLGFQKLTLPSPHVVLPTPAIAAPSDGSPPPAAGAPYTPAPAPATPFVSFPPPIAGPPPGGSPFVRPPAPAMPPIAAPTVPGFGAPPLPAQPSYGSAPPLGGFGGPPPILQPPEPQNADVGGGYGAPPAGGNRPSIQQGGATPLSDTSQIELQEQARIEAIRIAEIDRARIATEQRIRLEALAKEQSHERQLAPLAANARKSGAKIYGVLAGFLSMAVVALGGYYYGIALPERERAEAAAQAQKQAQAEALAQQQKIADQIKKLQEQIASSKDPAEKKALESKLEEMTKKKPPSNVGGQTTTPKGNTNCKAGDPMCGL